MDKMLSAEDQAIVDKCRKELEFNLLRFKNKSLHQVDFNSAIQYVKWYGDSDNGEGRAIADYAHLEIQFYLLMEMLEKHDKDFACYRMNADVIEGL